MFESTVLPLHRRLYVIFRIYCATDKCSCRRRILNVDMHRTMDVQRHTNKQWCSDQNRTIKNFINSVAQEILDWIWFLPAVRCQWRKPVAMLASHHFCTDRTYKTASKNNQRLRWRVETNASLIPFSFRECTFQSNKIRNWQCFDWIAISPMDFGGEHYL